MGETNQSDGWKMIIYPLLFLWYFAGAGFFIAAIENEFYKRGVFAKILVFFLSGPLIWIFFSMYALLQVTFIFYRFFDWILNLKQFQR